MVDVGLARAERCEEGVCFHAEARRDPGAEAASEADVAEREDHDAGDRDQAPQRHGPWEQLLPGEAPAETREDRQRERREHQETLEVSDGEARENVQRVDERGHGQGAEHPDQREEPGEADDDAELERAAPSRRGA